MTRLDSLVGVSSTAAAAWQFSARDPETREKTAPRIIAFLLGPGGYVAVDAVRALVGAGGAVSVHGGIVPAAVSLPIGPVLSIGNEPPGGDAAPCSGSIRSRPLYRAAIKTR